MTEQHPADQAPPSTETTEPASPAEGGTVDESGAPTEGAEPTEDQPTPDAPPTDTNPPASQDPTPDPLDPSQAREDAPVSDGSDRVDVDPEDVSRGRETPADGLPEGVEPVMSLQEAQAKAAANDGGDATALDLEEAQDLGYVGTSPGRLYTGRADDGLSQEALGLTGGEVKPVQEGEPRRGHYAPNGQFIPEGEEEAGDFTTTPESADQTSPEGPLHREADNPQE